MTELTFHHIGVACRNIDAEEKTYSLLGYEREGSDFDDPVQGVRGRFLTGPGPRVELLEQLPGSSVLEPWLTSGSRMYHQAFEVDDVDVAITELDGVRVVTQPVAAIAFGNRRIAFVMTRTMTLFELIER